MSQKNIDRGMDMLLGVEEIGLDGFRNSYYMISHFFLLLFIALFLPHRYSKRKTGILCFSSFLFLSVSDLLKLNVFPDSDICYIVVTVFQILVTQFTAILISKKRDSRVLFMGLSASNYVIAGSIAASIFYIGTGSMIIALVGSIGIHAIILLFLYIRLNEPWMKCCEKEYGNSWWELCMIPVFFYCGFFFLAFFPYTLYDNPNNIPGVVIFIITMFVSYVVVMRYVESEERRSGIYWKNIQFESYIKGLENQYYVVEQAEQNLKIMRHDMRHYSAIIDSLLDQGEYDEIRKITQHINAVVDENKVTKYCNNLIVNAIVSNLLEKVQFSHIAVQLDMNVPKDIPVNAYEFAAVLANLLENALVCVKDFEEEKRYIEGEVHCMDEHLLIHLRNEYKKEMVFDPVTGLPNSGKGKNHGLGMQSVLSFSDKIGGNVGCYCENGMFHIVLFAKF